MSRLRIPASKTFALEMVRAALFNPAIPREYRLTGMWMHLDMEMGDDARKSVAILISIYGANSEVEAHCDIENDGDGWVRGTCRIELVADRSQKWEFDCRIEDDSIVATLK